MLQKEALEIMKTGVNCFLTGEPGSGKTHTINAYIDWLKQKGHMPVITASTGIAATHIRGVTIHSWSGMGIKEALTKRDIDLLCQKEYLVKRLQKVHVLIIDEISMLSAPFLDSLSELMKEARDSRNAFGGVQVIFVGDFFQLPPVSKDSPQYCFKSSAWSSANILTLHLDEQYRQTDDQFYSFLKGIRDQTHDESVYELLGEYSGEPKEDSTKLYTHNVDVDKENQEQLRKLPGASKLYTMKGNGKKEYLETLKKGCLSPESLLLKEDAVVMFTRNHHKGEYVNGTTGTITGFSDTKLPLVTLTTGEEIEVLPSEWIYEVDGKVLARIEQIPLRLAWAMTVHKSQGMTLSQASIDLSKAFTPGQGYVALSRLSGFDGLTLTGFSPRALMVSEEVQEFSEHIKSVSEQVYEHFFEKLSLSERKKLEEQFVSSLSKSESSKKEEHDVIE